MVELLRKFKDVLQPVPPAAPLNHAGRPGLTPAQRNSNGLQALTAEWAEREGLSVLDLGRTSHANVNFIAGYGHRVLNEDLLRITTAQAYRRTGENGEEIDLDRFLEDNLCYRPGSIDAVLLWDLADYLPEPLVKPLVARIADAMKPGGTLLAYFHTKDAGPDSPFCRYEIGGPATLLLRRGENHSLQRIFNNRHIENLFREFRSIKFFLARDNLREVLVTR